MSEALHLLEDDRKLRRDLKRLIENNKNHNKPFHIAIMERFAKKGRLGQLKGIGTFALHGLTALASFIFSAEFFAARELVTSVQGPEPFNITFSENQRQSLNVSLFDVSCSQYRDETSSIQNVLLNMLGYCGAVQAVFYGSSLSKVTEGILKKGENLYIAVQESEFIAEIQNIFCQNRKVKIPAVVISAVLAYCYRSLASSNAEYLDELSELKNCDIDGFNSYLPSIPDSSPFIVNASYFIAMNLYLLPFMMIFDLVLSDKHQPSNAEILEDNKLDADGEPQPASDCNVIDSDQFYNPYQNDSADRELLWL